MADTTKIYENIFIKKNAAGDREYIKVPYAILADPPTIPDVSGFMPKSGGTMTGSLTIQEGSSINVSQYNDAGGVSLMNNGGGTATQFGSSTRPARIFSSVQPEWYKNGVSQGVLALKSDIPDVSGKLDKSGGTVTGNLTVGGNLTVNGTTTTVDSTTLQVKDKLIEVAHGNTTTLTTPAGLVAPKYDGTNSGALVFDSTGTAYVGDVTLKDGNIDVAKSGLQPLATRTGLVGGNLVQYDSSAQTLKDSGKNISDLALKTDISGKLSKTENTGVSVLGTTKATTTLGGNQLVAPNGIIFAGTAANAGLVTRGICGVSTPDSKGACSKENLYINYDGNNDFNAGRQVVLNAGAVGNHLGSNMYQYTVPRGEIVKNWVEAKGYATTDQIPTVNNGTLTIQKNGTNVATFGANQSTNATANITVPTKVSELTNDSGYTTNKGTITGITMNGASKGTSGVVDLGTVLTDASAFATSAQGTKADNAMPKSGGTFTGNITVPKTITFTDETNPFIKMRTGGTDFYFQSTSGQFGLGPTWNKATHWDSNGNVAFPTVPKVGDSLLALKSEIPTMTFDGTTLTINL